MDSQKLTYVKKQIIIIKDDPCRRFEMRVGYPNQLAFINMKIYQL